VSFDVDKVRADFPILQQEVHGKPLAYLDSAATSQKPRQVLEAVSRFYERDNGAVHRAVHMLGERSTRAYEEARAAVAGFIGAGDPREVVFLRGTTEAINLVASSWGRSQIGEGDEVLVTEMEHHSNIVPWQLLCDAVGAQLRVVPVDDAGALVMDELDARLGPRTKLVAVTHVSNVLGTVNPLREIAERAHAQGALVLVDGAQGVPHLAVDVGALGCDFYAFSGHKVFAPTGIGALWARHELLDAMPPWQGGGGMIASVSFAKTTWAEAPERFEAGSPNTGGAVGLATALRYVESLGMGAVESHERDLVAYAHAVLSEIPGLHIFGAAENKTGVVSFVLDGVHAHDLGTILDREGVAVRAGHHCAQPLMERYGVAATVRASFAIYNTRAEVDALVQGLHTAREIFGA
jgi:cysteine desulfurase/selenocysteine lyase